jgi:hypothetical protein
VMPSGALGFRTVLLLAAATLLTAQTTVSDAQQRSKRRLHGNVQTSTRRPKGLGPDDPWCWSSCVACLLACLLDCLLLTHADLKIVQHKDIPSTVRPSSHECTAARRRSLAC